MSRAVIPGEYGGGGAGDHQAGARPGGNRTRPRPGQIDVVTPFPTQDSAAHVENSVSVSRWTYPRRDFLRKRHIAK